MAETSMDRVTITLGRSGQVVKRGSLTSDALFSDSKPAAVGTKRSVRDRLGNSGDGHLNGSLSKGNNKRQRGDIGRTASLRANGLDDVHIDKSDLRLKLMRKSAARQARSNDNRKFGGDLRDKLKKRRKMPTRDSKRYSPGQRERDRYGQPPLSRSSDDLSKMDSYRESYSPWVSDHFKRRLPNRVPDHSRGLSPLRSVEDAHRRPLSRTFDDIGSVRYMSSKDVIDTTRPMTSVAFQSTSVLPPGSLMPVPPHLSQIPPRSGIVPKGSYMVDVPQTVDGFLHSLGLEKYVVTFKAEEVDMAALKQMGENDLKELGIPMGPRKKILLALLTPSKRQS